MEPIPNPTNRMYLFSTVVGDSRSSFMLPPGGGVNVRMDDSTGIVGQIDYRRTFLDDEKDGESNENRFRIVVGMRFSF